MHDRSARSARIARGRGRDWEAVQRFGRQTCVVQLIAAQLALQTRIINYAVLLRVFSPPPARKAIANHARRRSMAALSAPREASAEA